MMIIVIPVISGADVRDVGLAPDQMLSGAEVAQLQNSRLGVKQKVLGLDVSVTNALKRNIE